MDRAESPLALEEMKRHDPYAKWKRQHRTRTDRQWYSGRRWRKLRELFLMDHPLCVDPFGLHGERPVPATEVHHKIPRRQRPDLAYDEENLEGLCKPCHSKKTASEQCRN